MTLLEACSICLAALNSGERQSFTQHTAPDSQGVLLGQCMPLLIQIDHVQESLQQMNTTLLCHTLEATTAFGHRSPWPLCRGHAQTTILDLDLACGHFSMQVIH